jgi:homogentisate 1,2-dioxygenase
VHAGSGEFFCDYGHLSYRTGDYLLLPRGTMWRVEPAASTDLLMIEATAGNYGLPDRGMLGRHAIFDAGVLDRPALDDHFRAQAPDGPWKVVVKRGGRLGQIVYRSTCSTLWDGKATHPVRPCRRHPPGGERAAASAAVGAQHVVSQRSSVCWCRVRSKPIPAR